MRGNDYALSPIQDSAQEFQRRERLERQKSHAARKTKHGRSYASAESRYPDRRPHSSNRRSEFNTAFIGDGDRDRRSQSRHSRKRAMSAYAYADNWGASSKRR
jgi:hypothetical protein